ncbi:caspase family protein [Streptomyces triticiradicis]|uniref:Peptidase C14 caspase domain-containing protein n=1 Tax=Streptomyces triticiradicis TaxID=2651189 RepID=A0A7J5DAC1_9ACTN|nr:caspase family protein [Streptomyces triticiradicis]KAB1985693.1 hypothetical protein F8144_25770 [Streptomyces triticiradicis]
MTVLRPDGTGAGEDGPRRFLIATATAKYTRCPAWDRRDLVAAREQIIEVFTRRLGYRHVTGLGLDPTRLQLTDQLRAFCKADDRREDDLVAVYLSGHGEVLDDGGDHVLLMADTDPDDVAYTALATVDLARTMLRKTKVRRLLLILDTCYSGQGGNELAATALERISRDWGEPATGSGLVIVSSAQPHQQAQAGLFPRLFTDAVEGWATAGHGPTTLSVSAVVQQINSHPGRPSWQRVSLSQVGLTGEPPAFFTNPHHSSRLTGVDLALQQAVAFDEQARRRETELTTRLLVRAMGCHGDASQGWWFCGRHTALADLTAWLRDPAPDDRPCRVVTAGPGSGKTAVLGLIAALTHPERRRTVPLDALGLDSHLVPEPGTVDVALYAQNLSDADVLHGLSAAVNMHADTVGELLGALDAIDRDRPLTVMIDALDEATTPHSLCCRVLRPLIEHSYGRIRLLLGTRPYLLDQLGIDLHHPDPAHRRQVVNLDDERYADPQALTAYITRNLLEAHPASPYRHEVHAVRPVAEAVAEAAGTSFLVARITAGALAADPVLPDPQDAAWRTSLPRHAGQAMHADLTRRLGRQAERAEHLLRPLAFAEGQGLPWEDIWAPIASAVSGHAYTDSDLLWLRREAGSYVVEATEKGRSAYRLYHQSLAEHLRNHTDESTVHAAFTDVLTTRVPLRGDATRDWSRAHPYILTHLATHAAKADRLDALLAHSEYLVHASPSSLAPQLHRAHTYSARLAAAVYRTSLGLHAGTTPNLRRQLLALDAARAGASKMQRHLTRQIPLGGWSPRWATGSSFSPGLRDTLTGHSRAVTAVSCAVLEGSPIAVTGSDDGTVRVWDLRSGRAIGRPLTGHSMVGAVSCTMLEHGLAAVTGSGDGTVQVWDLRSGRVVGPPLTGHTGRVLTVACTMLDGNPIAVTGSADRTVRIWNLATRTQIGEAMTGHTRGVLAVACASLEGNPVAVTGSGDGTVRVWDLRSGRAIGRPLTGHTGRVLAVACTELDGNPVAVTGSGSIDRSVRVWDLRARRAVGQPLTGHKDRVAAVSCAVLDGSPVAVSGSDDGTVRVWDLRSGLAVGQPLTGHAGTVGAVSCAVLEGTPVAVTGSGPSGIDSSVRVWNLPPEKPTGWPVVGHTGKVLAVACTTLEDMPIAVTGSDNGTVRLWNLATGSPIGRRLTGHTGRVTAVSCAVLDGGPIAITSSGFGNGTVRVWDLATSTPLGELLIDHAGLVMTVACTVIDGVPVVVTGSGDGTVRLWDLKARTPLGRPMTGHSGRVTAVACTVIDGVPVAVTGSGDGTVRLWDLKARTPLGRPMTGHSGRVTAVACTVIDGVPVAVTGSDGFLDNTVRVWNLATGSPVGRPYTDHSRRVTAVACAVINDTPIAFTASEDRTVRVRNLHSGKSSVLLVSDNPRAVAVDSEQHLVVGFGREVAVFHSRSTERNVLQGTDLHLAGAGRGDLADRAGPRHGQVLKEELRRQGPPDTLGSH